MVPFLKKILPFGEQSNTINDAAVDANLDIQRWISAHREWRQRLIRYVEGDATEYLDETILSQDDHCDLGKWIHGHGHKHFGDIPVFHEIKSDHAAFHHAAGKVIGAFRDNGPAAAKKALQTDFDRCSMRVISGLERLEKHVKS